MDRKSIFNSNISLDSLEIESKTNPSLKEKASDANDDTILVPFYEKDVLIKVPKGNKRQRQPVNNFTRKYVYKDEPQQCKNYLMNKQWQNNKKTSYLETFRKKFASNCNEVVNKVPKEIRSISPEFGDTDRESIGEECHNDIPNEFYDTESYNEIYYEKLMNQELEQYLEKSFQEALLFNEEIRSKTPEGVNDLRSISEVSRSRRHARRITVPYNQNIQLGGLGPDMENIKPRLERAKSLQRYSEKVRMENRLKIYKKEMEAENVKKAGEKTSAKQRESCDMKHKEQTSVKKSSYLINKTTQEKSSPINSKSADIQKRKGWKSKEIITSNNNSENLKPKEIKPNLIERKVLSAKDNLRKYLKPSYEEPKTRRTDQNQNINTEKKLPKEVSPIEISLSVNVGKIRPSSALKSLEEKHRIYQDKVKEFAMDPNNV